MPGSSRLRWVLLAAAAAAAVPAALPLGRAYARQKAFLRNMRNLEALRRSVAMYRQANGRWPESLADAGTVPALAGLQAEHPASRPAEALDVELEWLTLAVTFWHPYSAAGASLVGSWNRRDIERTPMRCDAKPSPDGPAAGGCWTARSLQPGAYLYAVFPGDAAPSLPLTKREISLRYPHGEGVLSADAGDTLQDAGQWAYDRRTGAVFIACTHSDQGPRGGLPLYKY